MLEVVNKVRMTNEPLPQLLIFGQRWHAELPLEVSNALTDETTGCYELYRRIIFAMFEKPHTYGYKYIFRINERCKHRVVKRGYHQGNKEFG